MKTCHPQMTQISPILKPNLRHLPAPNAGTRLKSVDRIKAIMRIDEVWNLQALWESLWENSGDPTFRDLIRSGLCVGRQARQFGAVALDDGAVAALLTQFCQLLFFMRQFPTNLVKTAGCHCPAVEQADQPRKEL